MEGLLVLLLLFGGVSILVSPILASVALRRVNQLKKYLTDAEQSQKLLSEQVTRLQSRLQKLQGEFEGLKVETRVEAPEAEARMDEPPSRPEATSEKAEAETTGTSPSADAVADEAEGAKAGHAPEENALEEPFDRPAVAAAKAESPWGATARADVELPADEEDREQVPDEISETTPEAVPEELVAAPEEHEPKEEADRPSKLAARVSSVPHGDLERTLSTNWLVWIGGISLAIAGIFLVRYIAEQGWLSPALRSAIGVVFGVALSIAGEVVRRRPLERAFAAVNPDYVPQALTAAGLVTAFGSIYLAYAFYELIPSGWSFSALAAITLAAFALSLVQGKFVALLGLAGAIATPALVSTDDPSNWGFFTYLGFVALATVAVADRKRWFWLPELSLLAIAGWTALWLRQAFGEADILPIGVTLGLVALAGFMMARRVGLDSPPNNKADRKFSRLSVGADEVAGTGFLLALGSAYAMALLSDFQPAVHWLLLIYALAAATITRLLTRFDWILTILAASSILVIGLVYVDESALANLSERLLGTPAPTDYFADKYQKYILHGALLAVALFVGGVQVREGTRRARAAAIVTGIAPLALLVIGYAQFRNFSGDAVWVWSACATIMAAIAATVMLSRRKGVAAGMPGFYAAVAVVAAFLALTFQFDRVWLTLSYAGLVFILAMTSTRTDFDTVRKLVNLIVLLVLVRLTVNPDLRGYEIFHALGMQWVSYGYLVPLALFLAASRIFKRAKDDLTVTVLEGAALLLGIVFISIEIRIFMTGSIYSGKYQLPEASLQTIAWLTSALVLARRNLRYPRLFSTWGSRILTAAGTVQAIALQLVLMNPIFTGEFIDGYGLVNMLILSLVAPAVLIWLIAGSLVPKEQPLGGPVTALLCGVSGLLAFAFVTEEVRVFFQGMVIRPEQTSLLELYITTLAWLIPASALFFVDARSMSHQARALATVVVCVALLMLVFGHGFAFNPVISGEVVRGWPAINTLLIGFLLPAVLLYWVAKHVDLPLRGLLLAGAYLLVLVWVWLSLKHSFQGPRLVVFHRSLLELYITTLAWIALGAAPFFVRRIGMMAEAKRAGLAILAVSVAMLFVGHALIFNPVFDKKFVPGWPVLNVLQLGFIVPAALIGLISLKLDRQVQTLTQAAAYVLLFVGITMLVKHAFQGEVMTLATLTDIENYGYSAAWLALALVTMIAGIVRDKGNVRYASLAVLLLVVLKVFLLDMSRLAGLWRIASFFGLGISLVGIGYVYQHFIYREQTAKASPAEKPEET